MNEDIKFNLLIFAMLICSMLAGVYGTLAYNHHVMNEYSKNVLLTAQDVMDTCKYNYKQDYKITELNDKYVIEVKNEKSTN